MAMPGMKSKAWKLIVIIGSVAMILIGFGGLFGLQGASDGLVQLFVIGFGVLTFALFAGPGLVYVARKRIPAVKKRIPGGTLAWIRAHLYMPVLALVATWVHATIVPFRLTLTSGKVLAVLGVVVSIGGWARHKMIGVSKSAVNADVKISRIAAEHGRAFRQLVTDYKQLRRPTADIEADVAKLDADQQAAWAEVVEIQSSVDDQFPRGGGQTGRVRSLKLLKAVHAPLTIALFLVLAFHVWDVLGGEQAVLGDEKTEIANAETCADCHSGIYDEWAQSAMAHAQTSTIMEAQLPVTLTKNFELVEDDKVDGDFAEATLQACVNCHAPTGGQFTEDPLAFLPLEESGSGGEPAVTGGDKAVNSDGVSCVTCHTFDRPFDELEGIAPIGVGSDPGSLGGYGTFYGPVFDDPSPLPVRIHGIEDNGLFNDPISASLSCGACHNVKVDLDDDGLAPSGLEEGDDDDGNFQLNENELDFGDDGSEDLNDLVLQTTFDEWQDYVALFDDRFGDQDLDVDRPLGCIECHMPSVPGEEEPIVDYAPGFLPLPERETRSHTFIGVDYDPDPEEYVAKGLGPDAVNDVIRERKALLETAITLEVVDGGVVDGDVFSSLMTVRNNLLGHSFPTGFAFARQFWFEVSAETADGEQVCLAPVNGIEAPCVSGEVGERAAPVPQCDPVSVAEATGVDVSEVANGTIGFADALPVGECDPWLTNYQKILTDGDPDEDEVFTEVAFQSLLPDIVKTRVRVADGQRMDALQSTRLRTDPETGELLDESFDVFQYDFDTSGIEPGTEIVVTAKLRFRHLPPEFVRSLEAELEEVDDVPESAFIDAEELVDNIVITDVVTAESNEGEVLGCEGPQNADDGTLLDCIDEDLDDDELVEVALLLDGPHGEDVETSGISGAGLLPWAVSGIFAAAGWALTGYRRRPR